MRISSEHVHNAWDNSLPPVVTVDSGDTVELELQNSSGGQLHRDSTVHDVSALNLAQVNPVTGPVAVRGAQPGDALAVRVLELDTGDWGWTANIPGFGLLADDFPDAYLAVSGVGASEVTLPFGPRLPTVPMIGTIGNALPDAGTHSVIPPSLFGGNMDIRHLTAGCRLILPVGVPGALLSAGDAHAAMGDGEVCGTGVETSARAVLEVEVLSGAAPPAPVLETTPAPQRTGAALATTGIAPDLMVATRDATRSLVEHVVARTGLAPVEAYVLASVAGDLKISEVVDQPNWVVSAHLPAELL